MYAKSLQSCPTLCDPIDGSPPASPVPGILQARTLEWVAISFSNAWKWKVKVKLLSRVRPSVTLWTAAFQAAPSMGFSRQEYWSGLPLPSPRMMHHLTTNTRPSTNWHHCEPEGQQFWDSLSLKKIGLKSYLSSHLLQPSGRKKDNPRCAKTEQNVVEGCLLQHYLSWEIGNSQIAKKRILL